MSRFQIGDQPQWTYSPVDADGVPGSTAVTFTVIHPDGTEDVYTSPNAAITGDGTPDWVLTLPTLLAGDEGRWVIVASSTAGIIETTVSGFVVEGVPAVTESLCERWPILWPQDFSPGDYPPDLIAAAQSAAEFALWARGGRQHGTCTVTERYAMPVSSTCPMPEHDERGWRNVVSARACCGIILNRQPVQEVVTVRVDGDALDSGEWALDGLTLRRVDACWPSSSSCTDPRIEVTYVYGVPVGAEVAPAVGEVAFDYLRGFVGGECSIPPNAVNVTRQGVSVQLSDVILQRHPYAWQWVTLVNPKGLSQRARVMTPDLARVVR